MGTEGNNMRVRHYETRCIQKQTSITNSNITKVKLDEIDKTRNGPSKTAENVAFVRALESQKPEDERIYCDPYAIRFLSPEYLKFLEISIQYPEKAVFPGVQNSLVARARFIDDFTDRLIEDGLMQLVILGAGYDSRAYRIEGLKKIRTFEVDHPATQSVKTAKIRDILGSLPEHVTYVSADLETEDFGRRLMEQGYNRSEKTLFIMEGLLYYLPPHVVDEVLSFIAEKSGRGSSIVFDYIHESSVDGIDSRCGTQCTACNHEALKKARADLIQQGEPYKFGIKEGAVEPFLVTRGFSGVGNMTSAEYKNAYFYGINEGRAVCGLLYFAHAVVK
jgi:methyltransferase (TIGR00027 family)